MKKKKEKKKVKAQFEVARTIKSGEWIFTLKLWKATQMKMVVLSDLWAAL